MTAHSKIIEIKNITDKISPTFCLAKWHHPTIMLQTGFTTSCCHVPPHKISTDELNSNPAALHNTARGKQDRAQLLAGNQVKGCEYCWNMENMDPSFVSARHEWNASIYTPERVQQILDNPMADVNPQYLEVSFGNECNFKCGYCHPKFSSAYYKEIKEKGPYPTKHHGFGIKDIQIYEEETNPYVDAWWKWWPEASKSINILRITGGEPLLQKSTWQLLDDLQKNPLPNIELSINSNLGIKSVLVNRLTDKIALLQHMKAFKSFKLFTSVDTWGPAAEYARTGLDLKLWEENLKRVLQLTKAPVILMVTFNVLSVTSFTRLLEKILEWRRVFQYRLSFDVQYLTEPLQYSILLLPKQQFLPYMHQALTFMKANTNDEDRTKFSTAEYKKFEQIVTYMETTNLPDHKLISGRRDFSAWFAEHDARRNTNFAETFPDMVDIFNEWKTL
jgi:organic radical activating enzyme